MSAALSEVQEFCDEHSWLAEIHAFVSVWDEEKLEAWRGQTTNKIEVGLEKYINLLNISLTM